MPEAKHPGACRLSLWQPASLPKRRGGGGVSLPASPVKGGSEAAAAALTDGTPRAAEPAARECAFLYYAPCVLSRLRPNR